MTVVTRISMCRNVGSGHEHAHVVIVTVAAADANRRAFVFRTVPVPPNSSRTIWRAIASRALGDGLLGLDVRGRRCGRHGYARGRNRLRRKVGGQRRRWCCYSGRHYRGPWGDDTREGDVVWVQKKVGNSSVETGSCQCLADRCWDPAAAAALNHTRNRCPKVGAGYGSTSVATDSERTLTQSHSGGDAGKMTATS